MTGLRSRYAPAALRAAAGLAGLALAVLSYATVAAQTAGVPVVSPAQPTVTVAPGRLAMVVDSGSPVATQIVTVTNTYAVDLRVSAAFQGIDEAANLLVPLGNVDSGLAPSLKLSETDIIIPARGSKQLTVQVSDLPSLRAGGHYATLVTTPLDRSEAVRRPAEPAGGSAIRSAISVSLYITKQSGSVAADINVNAIGYERRWFGLPISADIKLVNAGNVHGVPRAIVRLVQPNSNTVLSQGVVNQNSQLLRPGKQLADRIALRSLVPLDSTWKPQRLQLQVQYRVDGDASPRTVSKTVWYVPSVYLAVLPVLLAAGSAVWWTITRAARRRLR